MCVFCVQFINYKCVVEPLLCHFSFFLMSYFEYSFFLCLFCTIFCCCEHRHGRQGPGQAAYAAFFSLPPYLGFLLVENNNLNLKSLETNGSYVADAMHSRVLLMKHAETLKIPK